MCDLALSPDCDPVNCTLPGSAVQEIVQKSSQPRDATQVPWTCVSCGSWTSRCIIYHPATWEALYLYPLTMDPHCASKRWSNRDSDSACDCNSLVYPPCATQVFWNRIYQIAFFFFRGIFVFLLDIKDFKGLAYVLFFLPFIIYHGVWPSGVELIFVQLIFFEWDADICRRK